MKLLLIYNSLIYFEILVWCVLVSLSFFYILFNVISAKYFFV